MTWPTTKNFAALRRGLARRGPHPLSRDSKSAKCGWRPAPCGEGGKEPMGSAVVEAAKKNGHAPTDAAEIQIDRIAAETIRVPILGTTPLIVHRFSEKAKRKMLNDMQGRKSPKEPKNPEAEFEAAFYRLEDGTPGFPAVAFKDATCKGARFYGKDVTMTGLRQFLFFRGEVGDDGRALVRIDGDAEMREDVVRVGQGGTGEQGERHAHGLGRVTEVGHLA